MSGVKIFGLGVLIAGILASSARADTMDSSTEAPRRSLTAAANLAGNWTGFGSPISGRSYYPTANSRPGGLTLGTTGTSTSVSPINFRDASFRIANSVPGATSNPPVASPWQPAAAPSRPIAAPSVPAPAASTVDAFIDLGPGPFAESRSLTTGNPRSFLDSPVFSRFYGPSGPSSQDVANFESEVVSTVQRTYNNADLPVSLTTDPDVPAAHTVSVVSNASNPENPEAIGITQVGGDGYTFIDKFGSAESSTQLATAVGNNVAHELMHAFGLAGHPETEGPYVDAAVTTFDSLSDPETGFSPATASLLSTLDFQATSLSLASGSQEIEGDQSLVPEAAPVPEPSTILAWALAGTAIVAYRRRKSA